MVSRHRSLPRAPRRAGGAPRTGASEGLGCSHRCFAAPGALRGTPRRDERVRARRGRKGPHFYPRALPSRRQPFTVSPGEAASAARERSKTECTRRPKQGKAARPPEKPARGAPSGGVLRKSARLKNGALKKAATRAAVDVCTPLRLGPPPPFAVQLLQRSRPRAVQHARICC